MPPDARTYGTGPSRLRIGRNRPVVWRAIRTLNSGGTDGRLNVGAVRDLAEGEPSPPSLHLPKGGVLRFRLPVAPGARAISIRARQPSGILPRPRMRLLANPEIGLNEDLSAFAPLGDGWVTVGPVTFIATQAGGVVLELFAPWDNHEAGCWFDGLTVA